MLQSIKAFLAQPYSDDMDAADWFAFLGFIAVCSAIWVFILRHLKANLE